MISCIVTALLTGHSTEAASAVLSGGDEALKLLLTLMASMTMWSGLMEILNVTGDVARLGRMLKRIGRPIYPGLRDDSAWSAMGMNISANMLGLGNAATPAGIEAAKLLAGHAETGLKALAMLLVIDNASLQLMPANVISMRLAAGSTEPAAVWLPTVMVSGASMITGVILLAMLQRGEKGFDRLFGCDHVDDCSLHHPARNLERRGHI